MKSVKQTKFDSKVGAIKLLHKKRTGALTYVQRGANQTAVDGSGVSLDFYIHALYGLALQSEAEDILMIGCGGGTLGTMLARAGKRVTIVDVDKTPFVLARRHFHLPKEIKCRVSDGLAFLQRARKRYDVVIVDAFIGERIPKHLTGDDFCRAARRCVQADGVLLMNVCLSDRNDRTAERIAARFLAHGWEAKILDRPRIPARNGIVIAGAVKGLVRPKLLVPPATGSRRIARELGAARMRRIHAA